MVFIAQSLCQARKGQILLEMGGNVAGQIPNESLLPGGGELGLTVEFGTGSVQQGLGTQKIPALLGDQPGAEEVCCLFGAGKTRIAGLLAFGKLGKFTHKIRLNHFIFQKNQKSEIYCLLRGIRVYAVLYPRVSRTAVARMQSGRQNLRWIQSYEKFVY